jgi:cell division protein FtsB
MTSDDIKRGSNPFLLQEISDLEKTREKLEKRVEELEADREILKQDIDRLSEYNQNLETMLRSKK